MDSVKNSALERLMLKLLQKLPRTKCQQLLVLYGQPDDLIEYHEILKALKENKKLVLKLECLEFFTETVEAIGCQEKDQFISEANNLKKECIESRLERQGSYPFNVSPPSPHDKETVQLASSIEPVQEQGSININQISEIVAPEIPTACSR